MVANQEEEMRIWSGSSPPILPWKKKSSEKLVCRPTQRIGAARRALGNTMLIREQAHEAWGWAPFERLAQDLRYALRQLRHAPGFTFTAVVILGLGIGAATAVFSLIDAALLKMLPVRHPEQLVELKNIDPHVDNDAFSYPTFKNLEKQSGALAGAVAFRKLHNIDVEIDGRSELAEGQLVSGSYFPVLGVKAIQGRSILPSDELAGAPDSVAVIGYDFWRTRFALDPGIVGKHVLLNNAPFTIIGVTEPEFYGVQPRRKGRDFRSTLAAIATVNSGFAATGSRAKDAMTAPFRNWLHVMGRVRDGVSREKAQASLEPVFAQSMREASESLAGLPFDSPTVRAGISPVPAAS